MARAYCTVNDVKKYLPPNVVLEGENPVPNFRNPSPETASNIDVDFFIQQASAEIDGNLATQYDVPLKQVNLTMKFSQKFRCMMIINNFVG